MCCRYGEGQFFLFLGTTADNSLALVYNDGRFGSVVRYEFTVSDNHVLPAPTVPVPPQFTFSPTGSPTEQPTEPPSLIPTSSPAPSFSPPPTRVQAAVMIVFALDSYPGDTAWQILDSDGNEVASVPFGAYSGRDMASEVIELDDGFEYTLVVEDSYGDGMCCVSGEGQFFLFLGNSMDNTRVLVHNNGRFGSVVRHTFTVSINDVMPATDVPELPLLLTPPSLSPTPSPIAGRSNWKGNKGGKMMP